MPNFHSNTQSAVRPRTRFELTSPGSPNEPVLARYLHKPNELPATSRSRLASSNTVVALSPDVYQTNRFPFTSQTRQTVYKPPGAILRSRAMATKRRCI